MTTKKTKATKKRVNKRTIEVNPLDLLMVCTGQPKDSMERLNEVLDANPKNKSAQEAKAKLLEIEKQKKQSYYENLRKTYGEIIKKYNFDLRRIHTKLICSVLNGSLSESDFEYLIKNEKYVLDDLKSEMAPKELTRDCLIKAIVEIGGACVKNGELSEESFKGLKESLGVKSNKTAKDFKGLRLFKSCVEKIIHKGGDTKYNVDLGDEITDENEEIPDDGTIFTVKDNSVIVFGKDYEEIIAIENLKK